VSVRHDPRGLAGACHSGLVEDQHRPTRPETAVVGVEVECQARQRPRLADAGLGLLAILVVLGLVYLDDSIRSPADVQQYLELPLLGSIPRHQTSSVGRIGPFARWSGSHVEQQHAEAGAPTTAVRL